VLLYFIQHSIPPYSGAPPQQWPHIHSNECFWVRIVAPLYHFTFLTLFIQRCFTRFDTPQSPSVLLSLPCDSFALFLTPHPLLSTLPFVWVLLRGNWHFTIPIGALYPWLAHCYLIPLLHHLLYTPLQWFHRSSNGSVQTGTMQSSPGPVQEISGLGSDQSQMLTDWTELGLDRSLTVSRVRVYFPGC